MHAAKPKKSFHTKQSGKVDLQARRLPLNMHLELRKQPIKEEEKKKTQTLFAFSHFLHQSGLQMHVAWGWLEGAILTYGRLLP